MEDVKSVVQVGKPPRRTPQMIFNPRIAASLQNVDKDIFWRKGDPNTETTPDFDFVWVLWILRQCFPKDIVTHFVQHNGGFSFSVHRSYPLPSSHSAPKLSLQFWKQRDLYMSPCREIYFNVPVEKIVKKKDKVYLWHYQNKIAWIPN